MPPTGYGLMRQRQWITTPAQRKPKISPNHLNAHSYSTIDAAIEAQRLIAMCYGCTTEIRRITNGCQRYDNED